MNFLNIFVSIIFIFFSFFKSTSAVFFNNITDLIENNYESLRYGIAVADVNNDGNYEFIVAGFGSENLALAFKNKKIKNIINDKKFSDKSSFTIGVAACDIDSDGYEEIYFLNTDTYSGEKRYSDRLIDNKDNKFFDVFEQKKNQSDLNFTAGRSVVCVDRKGNGKYGIYVANYGGPTRFYEKIKGRISDKAKELGLDKITGGRAVVSGHILSDNIDIFAANERGVNFLYKNVDGAFYDVAATYQVLDPFENGRGTALSDVLYRGQLDIISGNWDGEHRIFVKKEDFFEDIADQNFKKPSKIRTVISADFDNDGYDEIFFNNIGEPNRLFKIKDNGKLEEIDLTLSSEPKGLGTGAAVADIDKDGVLELLIAHGETGNQILSLYKANIEKSKNFLRVKALNKNGAPARGATVTLTSNLRKHSKTIDSGSGYLCQMEPVAHYGIRDGEKDFKIQIKWTNGKTNNYEISKIGKTYIFQQSKFSISPS